MILSKKTKDIIIVTLDKDLKKTPLQTVFIKNVKTKKQIIINFKDGLIMELMPT